MVQAKNDPAGASCIQPWGFRKETESLWSGQKRRVTAGITGKGLSLSPPAPFSLCSWQPWNGQLSLAQALLPHCIRLWNVNVSQKQNPSLLLSAVCAGTWLAHSSLPRTGRRDMGTGGGTPAWWTLPTQVHRPLSTLQKVPLSSQPLILLLGLDVLRSSPHVSLHWGSLLSHWNEWLPCWFCHSILDIDLFRFSAQCSASVELN